MQIVTDSGTDVSLPPEQLAELDIHIVPLIVTLEGKSYREGLGGRFCRGLPAVGSY